MQAALEQIQREFDRNGPCAHYNWNPLGTGNYVHCEDCGQDVGIEYLNSAKDASEKHNQLSFMLRNILSGYVELSRDAERYRWLFDNYEWPDAVEYAVCDDGRKVIVDIAVDEAIQAEQLLNLGT